MGRILLVVGLLTVLLVAASQSLQSQPKQQATAAAGQRQEQAAAKPAADRSADEAAIRANAEAFVRAYNAHDAKAVAALFTAEAIIVDKDDDVSEGRTAIEKTFKEIFEAAPQKRLELSIESIRFLGPDLALETGSSKETDAPGEPPDIDRYTVLHVKRDGKWQMAMARDTEGPPPTGHEQLRPLGWLVGEWIDDDGRVVVASTCRWSEDKNFLLQEFDLKVEGREAMRVSQRIGWDPQAKRVRSWVFDSEGGFGESQWVRSGEAWIIRASFVRPDGETAQATNLLVPLGNDGYLWRSTDRVVAGEPQPAQEVKVVRKPPQPKK